MLTYPLVVESALAIQVLEQFLVFLATEEIQIGNLKVAPIMAEVPFIAPSVMMAYAEQALQPSNRRGQPRRIHHRFPHACNRQAFLDPEVVDSAE